MNTVQQLDLAKSCYHDKNYAECLNYLLVAQKNGSVEARRYFAYLLDTDAQFREVVEQNYYLHITKNVASTKVNVAAIISEGRLLKWQQKLLDLTFRNKFLNFRETKLSIPLLFHEPSLLEDHLAAGKRFTIDPMNDLYQGYDFHRIDGLSGSAPIFRYISDEFSRKRLLSPLSDENLSKRLLDLSRQTKHDLEESGVSTLFLSIGILIWPGDELHQHKEFRAPILLLPMKLSRKSAQDRFAVERSDEDTIINITLLEKLAQDYSVVLPGIDIDHLPEDNSGVDVALILQKFRDVAAQHDGWKVSDEVWLSSFSFEKFIMWNDLKNRAQSLLTNPLVNHLVNNPGKVYNDSVSPVLPEDIDRDYKCSDIFAPLSADSSQLSAVLSAAKGKTFVLHGPPGTGKSQTITNIIAECLAIGKSVLFVAEKRAALEVVYNRLSQLGLTPFCLELHSNKSGKQETLEQFQQAINLAAHKSPEDWGTVSQQLETEKKNLNDYVNALHQVYPVGLSPYQAICYLIAHPESFSFSVQKNIALITQNDFEDLKRLGRTISSELRELPESAWDNFRHLDCKNWTPDWERNVKEISEWMARNIPVFINNVSHLCNDLGFGLDNQSIESVNAVCALAKHLSQGESIPRDLYGADWRKTSSILKDFIPLGQQQDDILNELRSEHIAQLLPLGRLSTSRRITQGQGHLFIFSPDAPLKLSSDSDDSFPTWGKEFFMLAKRYVDSANDLVSNIKLFFDTVGLSFEYFSEKHIFNALPIAQLAISAPSLPKDFFTGEWNCFASDIREMIIAGKKRDTVREKIKNFDLDRISVFDTQPIREEIEKNGNRPKVFRKLLAFFTCRKIKILLKDPKTPVEYGELPQLLDQFDEYAVSQKILNTLKPEHESRLGMLWNQTNADWDQLASLLQWGDQLHVLTAAYLPSPDDQDQLCGNICLHLNRGDSAEESPFIRVSNGLAGLWDQYAKASDLFFEFFFKNVHGNSKNARGTGLASEFVCTGADEPPSQKNYRIGDYVDLLGRFAATHIMLFSIAEKHRLHDKIEYWWKNGVGSWDKLKQVVKYLDELEIRGKTICRENQSANERSQHFWAELLHNSERMLFVQSPLQQKISSCDELWHEVRQKIVLLQNLVNMIPAGRPDHAPDGLERYAAFAEMLSKEYANLRYWCLWKNEREKALAAGLDSIVLSIEDKIIKCDRLPYIIEHALIRKFCDEVFSVVGPLRDFLGTRHEDIIKNFQIFDEKYADLTKRLIISKLAERLPSLRARRGQPIDGTPLGVLQRELNRQRGHKPIRKLLEEIGDILFDLKPCFLMSPLSVAQFLPAEKAVFDVIIFDEASQIPMEDAVGAIARGKQLIVAGDPKQLPPTIFFKNHSDDDANEDNIVELESLLQECLADGFYQSHLLWHYRSRDESLIAFSNAHYYDNSLWTFPAPTVKNGAAIHFNFVRNGIYDRTKTGTNPVEASAVVRQVVAKLTDPAFGDRSLGIVTFSIKQQFLIEDMLDEARRNHPEIEKFFDPSIKEPVFVKNLENVQGDERDVIFFSIGYAPDASGKFYMNFGPLNIDKGERRLNVAITRAKEEIVVFSSIHADDIDLSKTAKAGPRDLKEFLAFAETGVLSSVVSVNEQGVYGGLESEVAKFLRAQGYDVTEKIGNSAYKIDLAVVSPNHPERYVLGIECDGEYYKNTKSARDRDKLRVQILERLGWKLCHVWSPSWLADRSRSERKLLAELEDAIKTEEQRLQDTSSLDQPTLFLEQEISKDALGELTDDVVDIECGVPYPDIDYSAEPIFKDQILYPERFYEPSMRNILRQQLEFIISQEGPIVESLLQRRLVQTWGFNRIGNKISDVLSRVILHQGAEQQSDGQYVFWPQGKDLSSPENYTIFRIPNKEGTNIRRLEQIPLIEIKNAMLWFLKQYHAFSDEDALFRGTGRILGINRLTDQSKNYYSLAYDLLRQEGII